jgi:hypothetical protein
MEAVVKITFLDTKMIRREIYLDFVNNDFILLLEDRGCTQIEVEDL